MYGGRPMQINSWYRDPATNAAVGGCVYVPPFVRRCGRFYLPRVLAPSMFMLALIPGGGQRRARQRGPVLPILTCVDIGLAGAINAAGPMAQELEIQ